jgi:hypothetical protein
LFDVRVKPVPADFSGDTWLPASQLTLAASGLEGTYLVSEEDDAHGRKHLLAQFGAYLDQDEAAREGLVYLRGRVEAAPDPFVREMRLVHYLETLLLADPELAKAIYLAEPRDVIGMARFGAEIQHWHPLLEYPEVRARFDDHPEWIEFLRDAWPDNRPFPFDERFARIDEEGQ